MREGYKWNGIRRRGDKLSSQIRFVGMKKYVCLFACLGLFMACEQKETTINPPAEKKESNTTIVKPPAEKKESNTTIINPSQNQSPATTTREKTEININASPSP